MKKLKLSSIILVLLLSGCKSEDKTARSIASSSALCGKYKWDDSSLPLKLSIDSNLNNLFPSGSDTNVATGIKNSLKIWENGINRGTGSIFQSNMNILKSPTQHATVASYRFDSTDSESDLFGIYRSDDWFHDQSNNALAVTYYTITYSKSLDTYRLTSADIIFNFKHFSFYYSDASSYTLPFAGQSNLYDFRTILVHELGHFLGYCHVDSSEYSSVMQPYYSGVNHNLTIGDINYIRNLYGQSNSAPKGLSAISLKSKNINKDDEEEYSFVVELKDSGDCEHYHDGKLINSHKVKIR